MKMVNTSHSNIVRIGDVCIRTDIGYTMTLKAVRHIPDLRLKMIFGTSLDHAGYESHFGNDRWKLTKGSLFIASRKACNTLYKIHVKLCKGVLNAIEDRTSPNLWHKRLGHISEKGLQLLAKKDRIHYSTSISLEPCDYCLFGK